MRHLASFTCALSLVACASDGDAPVGEPDEAAAPREFSLRIENITPFKVLKSSAQRLKTTGVDGNAAPGEAYVVRFTAAPGQYLTFASTLVESNDWFFGPDAKGIPLYTDGAPTTGDVTRYVRLWDAGTEADQEPGVGDATCARQTARDAGQPDLDSRVRLVPDVATLANGSSYARPAVGSMIRVTLTPGDGRDFTLRIENLSTATTLQTSAGARAITLSPLAWALHRRPGALFDADLPARANGLEVLAETGQPDTLGSALRTQQGVATSLSRGVFVVHTANAPLFTLGTADNKRGLEALAEDGNERLLYDTLAAEGQLRHGRARPRIGTFDTPLEASEPGSVGPGQAFEVMFSGSPGDALSFATAFGAANDWFFAPGEAGIPLFLGDFPRWGDISSELQLYDLGTELDEELDVGVDTAAHQLVPNTGRPDPTNGARTVKLDRYPTPTVQHLRVTLTPLQTPAEIVTR